MLPLKYNSLFTVKSMLIVIYLNILFLLTIDLNLVLVYLFLTLTLLLSFKHPFISVTSFFCSLSSDQYFELYPGLNAALLSIVIISFFTSFIIKKRKCSLSKTDLLILLSFSYSLTISLIQGYQGILVISSHLIAIILIRLMLNNKILKASEIVLAFCIMFIFSGIIGLRTEAFGLSYGADSVNRFLSSFGDPNFYSLVGVVCLLGIYCLTNISRSYKFTIAAILLFFSLLTFSKTLLMLLAANILFSLYHSKLKFRSVFLPFSIAISAFILVSSAMHYFMNTNIIYNYWFRFFGESEGASTTMNSLTTGRYNLQTIALKYFTEQDFTTMLFGNGYIGTEEYFSKIGLGMITTHSVYFQILIDFGIIGALIYSLLFIRGYLNTDKKARPLIFTYFVGFFALSWQFSLPIFLFYILLGYKSPSTS